MTIQSFHDPGTKRKVSIQSKADTRDKKHKKVKVVENMRKTEPSGDTVRNEEKLGE